MRAVIDTSSWISLGRYYLPFDPQGTLLSFFRRKIEQGEFVLLDKVMDECRYTAKGIALQRLPFLMDKEFVKHHHPVKNTSMLLPPDPAAFYTMIENNFSVDAMKKLLSDVAFQNQKNEFIESADVKLIVYCLDHIQRYPLEPIVLVTEETETANDRKLFKKIPAICRHLGITVKTLPDLLEIHADEINLAFQ